MGRAHTQTSTFEARTFVHRTERGELALSVPAPSVLVCDYQGFTDATFVAFLDGVLEREFGASRFAGFVDTSGQTGYTSGFRTGMMAFWKKAIGRTDECVLLVKSRWVAMGIAMVRSTVGLPARHVEVSTDARFFRSKLDAAVRRSLESLAKAS